MAPTTDCLTVTMRRLCRQRRQRCSRRRARPLTRHTPGRAALQTCSAGVCAVRGCRRLRLRPCVKHCQRLKVQESPGFSNRVVCRHAAVATEAAVGPRGSSAVLGVYHVFCCAPWDAPAPVLCVKGGGRRAHSRRWCLCRDVIQGMRARCRRPQCAAPRRRSDGSGAAAAWGGAQQEWKVGG